MALPTVGVVVLNWRMPHMTCECVASLLQSTYAIKSIIVVDNDSQDGSLGRVAEYLRDWPVEIRGPTPVDSPLRETCHDASRTLVTLVQADVNGGYAAGNNLGIRLLLHQGMDWIWVLNNDTVVDPNALARLVIRGLSEPRAAIIGATLLDMGTQRLQCAGGAVFNWCTGRSHLIGAGLMLDSTALEHLEAFGGRATYMSGASLFLRASAVSAIGLLEEGFFLYFEEVDYAERARRAGWQSTYAPDAWIWHAFGASAGSSRHAGLRSTVSIRYGTRGAIWLVKRHRPGLVLVVILARVAWVVALLGRGAWRQACAALAGVREGIVQFLPPLK